MPSRYSIRLFAENTIYHVYNRGVEKRKIFLDEQDYKVFLNYLKEYLSPKLKPEEIIRKEFNLKDRIFKGVSRQPNNYCEQVELLAYCLMPNHFHFLIKQTEDKNSLTNFIHSLLLRYSMYFNKKYEKI
jgi:putative transposase